MHATDINHVDLKLPNSWNQHKAVRLDQCVEGKPIIVDTGSTFSLLPARSHEQKCPANNDLFKGAQGATIPVYGQRTIPVNIGTGRSFNHTFFVAGVQDPLLGMDFLLEHRLLVDPVNNRLWDADTFMTAKTNVVYIDQVKTSNALQGQLSHLWQEFPVLSEASVEKLAQAPKHSVEHDIVLKPGSVPARAKVRRLFGDKYNAAKLEIENMLRLGIIQRSKSDWASPLHVVPKGEGAFRPCGDFRHLNACTVPDKYPLPHIQDFTRDLKGAVFFSKIDLVRAFHQIPLSKNAISKTAMITPFGLFEFLRMPFGLCNAAQAFQRFMDMVTRGLDGVYLYIDDILVVSSTLEEHETRLRKLLSRLTEYGLIVNPSKSILAATEVNFLGFTINAEGVKPISKKVMAIEKFPCPSTFGQLSEFLGMVNFYHRFLPKCSEVAKPLYDILKLHDRAKKSSKAIPVSYWKKEQDKAFQKLKEMLVQASVLNYPDHTILTRLVTDASDVAAGAVLEQEINGHWKPIGFFSKSFHASELKYSTYDRELLAIKMGLQHFRHIIEGISSDLFHVATDHKPLTSGKNFTTADHSKTQLNRITRTWQFISELTTDIRHLAGSENLVADALSRNAINQTQHEALLIQLAREQVNVKMRPDDSKEWPEHWKIQEHHGITLAVDIRGPIPRPIVPDSMRRKIFDSFHSVGHLGIKATRKQIIFSYIWPNMNKDITEWVRSCKDCQMSKVLRHNVSTLKHFPPPSGKFQSIHVDIVGPLPTSAGHSYLLTIVDRFSRWPAAIPMIGISAKECANALINGWIQYYGVPLTVVSDRGRQFSSALWQELCNVLGTTHEQTTAYHPQANGLVERFHRQLKSCFMSYTDKNSQWYHDLPLIMLSIRNAVKEDIGTSSSNLVFGEGLRLPGAFFPAAQNRPNNTNMYIAELQERMAKTSYSIPKWKNEDKKHQELQGLNNCSHVFVLVSSVKTALQRPYTGPFKVLERREKTFKIELRNGESDVVSIDRLKPAHVL